MSNRNQLSKEILGLFGATAAIAMFTFGFLKVTANSIVLSYCEKNELVFTEMQEWAVQSWIQSISFVAAVIIFVILFLSLVGQKIGYLKQIIHGIEALKMHRMEYKIPLEGNNELTELAEQINVLAATERELQKKEAQIREEKESLIRTLSHDIRTPLTSILSYSEYLQTKDTISAEEIELYLNLMQQKAKQMKSLTDRLLDKELRALEWIEDGRFLMEQLADEWETELEEEFNCRVHTKECPKFSGEFDIQEFRRIFDNLASNVKKYADHEQDVVLTLFAAGSDLVVEQKNRCRQVSKAVESSNIGLESIRKIAEQYSGTMEVTNTESEFMIRVFFRIL